MQGFIEAVHMSSSVSFVVVVLWFLRAQQPTVNKSGAKCQFGSQPLSFYIGQWKQHGFYEPIKISGDNSIMRGNSRIQWPFVRAHKMGAQTMKNGLVCVRVCAHVFVMFSESKRFISRSDQYLIHRRSGHLTYLCYSISSELPFWNV